MTTSTYNTIRTLASERSRLTQWENYTERVEARLHASMYNEKL